MSSIDESLLKLLDNAQGLNLRAREKEIFNVRFGLDERGLGEYKTQRQVAKILYVTPQRISQALAQCERALRGRGYRDIQNGAINSPAAQIILRLQSSFRPEIPGTIDRIVTLTEQPSSFLFQKENLAHLIIYFLFPNSTQLINDIRRSRKKASLKVITSLEIKDSLVDDLDHNDAEQTHTEESNSYMPQIPEEIDQEETYYEGASIQVNVNTYERNRLARKKCIDYYGATCFICGFNFEETYGELAKGIIHIHHIRPLFEVNSEYRVNPISDLIPVCPNCHAVFHSKKPPYTADEMRTIIQSNISL